MPASEGDQTLGQFNRQRLDTHRLIHFFHTLAIVTFDQAGERLARISHSKFVDPVIALVIVDGASAAGCRSARWNYARSVGRALYRGV